KAEAIVITYEASEGGEVSSSSEEVTEGVDIKGSTATADEGYEFVNWTADEEIVSEEATFIPSDVTEDITYTANFKEKEVIEKEFNQSTVIDGIEISLYAVKGVLPADAILQVEKVSSALEENIKEAIDEETGENTEVEETFSFDIKIFSQEAKDAGENDGFVQPEDGTVSVTFDQVITDEEAEETALSVYHVEENGDEVAAVEQVAEPVENATDVQFDAEHFSIYTITVTYDVKRKYYTYKESIVFIINTVDENGNSIGEEKNHSLNLESGTYTDISKFAPPIEGYEFDYAYYSKSNNRIIKIELNGNNAFIYYEKEINNNNDNIYFVYNKKVTEYEITYYSNNGKNKTKNATTSNGKVTLMDSPWTRSGYTFLGWSTNKNADSAEVTAGTEYTPSANTKLYAIWQKNGTETPAATGGNINFVYVANSNEAAINDVNSVKYVIELVDENGNKQPFNDSSFIGTTISYSNEVAVGANTFDASRFGNALDGYTYDNCYFYWYNNYNGTKAQVHSFKNMGRISDDYSQYKSHIGYSADAPSGNSPDDWKDGSGYYAYNPTGILRVVFKKVSTGNGYKTNYYYDIDNANSLIATYNDSSTWKDSKYIYMPVDKRKEAESSDNFEEMKKTNDFLGWFVKEDNGKESKVDSDFFKKSVERDVYIFAKWKAKEYTVSFDTKGGSEVTSQTVKHNNTATKPVDPTKEGHEFAGWYKDTECKNAYDFETPIKENTTVY
ncbi:MAG: InlB B-repeat-containing protein, partial [Butyrivibrio sp.]|nr:InlB B-repeat-containing protein [Butyrivibrio sp.]